MGNGQSKLSPEQISDLRKHTHCEGFRQIPYNLPHQLTVTLVDRRDLQQW